MTCRKQSGQGDLLEMELFPQISRTEDENHIFYSWVDSDTSIVFGIGYGELNNLAPNWMVVGRDIGWALRTPVKSITKGDIIWYGRALFTTMAPTVLKNSTTFNQPIVGMEMQTTD